MIRVSFPDKDKFRRWSAEKFNRAKVEADLVKIGHQFGISTVGHIVDKYLRGRPGLKMQSGRLAESIKYRLHEDSGGYSIEFGTNVIYARIHEYGGTIVPKKAEALRFVIGGRVFYRRKVVIPKRPFMAPGIKDSVPDFRQRVAAYFGRMEKP